MTGIRQGRGQYACTKGGEGMHKTKNSKFRFKAVVTGLAGSVAVCIALTALCAALVSGEKLGVKSIPAASGIIVGLGASVGAYIGAKGAGERMLVYAGAVGGGLLLALLLGNLLFVQAPPAGWLRVGASVLAGTLLAGLLAGKRRKPSFRRKR